MGLTSAGTYINFEAGLEKFVRTSWEIANIINRETLEIVGAENEIFILSSWSEEIFKKSNKSEEL